ncbi:MAG: hypothetical protein ACE5D6_08455 [Candidatus Zixiibacteriota bacterium]
MSKITAILLSFILLFTLSSCSQGDKKITLRFKYEPGMHLTYEQISKRHSKVFESDSVIKDESTTYTVLIEQEVKRFVDDTTAEVFERDTWRYTKPNEKDSSQIDSVEYSQDLMLRVIPNGKVVHFEFVNKKDISRFTYIKNYYEQGLPVFPSGEKHPGYSWTQTTKVVLPDEIMEASTNYLIKSIVREAGYDCAVIEYDGTLLIPIEPNPDDSTRRQGIDRIHSKGMLYFAYKEGIVIKQREHWKIDGDRRKLKDDKIINYKIATIYDVDYILKKRIMQ